MDQILAAADASELAAAFLQAAITTGLAALFFFLFFRYRKAHFAHWGVAWGLYTLRLVAIITFLVTTDRAWLYWHQVATGWTALSFLWAALVFSRQPRWRSWYWVTIAFPPIWSYVAIYRLDNFLAAAGPAVAFMSAATLWTGWAFFRHSRMAGSGAAAFVAGTLFLWGLHHLDYPFLRARGAWNPWGYYLDIIFALSVGVGILVLVMEDIRGGLDTLSALSGDLRRGAGSDAREPATLLLERPLALPGVQGSALFEIHRDEVEPLIFAGGAGVCAAWSRGAPTTAREVIDEAVESHRPAVIRDGARSEPGAHGYVAALPVLQDARVLAVMVMVGQARDPFAALDDRFLTALGQQVGAALENAALYRRLERRNADLERLARRMVQHHEDERRRLSRELHDETAQVFSAAKFQLGMIRERASSATAGDLDRALALVDQGIASIRNLTNDLRPSLLDDLGMLPAMRALGDDLQTRSGVAVRVEAPAELPDLGPEAELALYRSLQEGLSNVAQHADARTVAVSVDVRDGWVRLGILDDGVGPPPPETLASRRREGHMGLSWMRERLHALGGSVTLEVGPDGGSLLRVELPVPTEAGE